jgi:hypothetical protein
VLCCAVSAAVSQLGRIDSALAPSVGGEWLGCELPCSSGEWRGEESRLQWAEVVIEEEVWVQYSRLPQSTATVQSGR